MATRLNNLLRPELAEFFFASHKDEGVKISCGINYLACLVFLFHVALQFPSYITLCTCASSDLLTEDWSDQTGCIAV